MVPRRHRIDFSLLRRHRSSSTVSSSDISPIVPVLQSPITFQVLAPQNVSETTLKQKNKLNRAPVTPSMFFEEKEEEEASVSKMARGPPADARTVRVAAKSSSIEEEPLFRTKSQYFDDVFSTRGRAVSPSTRVNQDSLVVVEVKVNTKIKDEDYVLCNILSRMARIYQKPEACMMVNIQQDARLRLGNSALPTYLMKIYALPYLIAPITNLRSTVLTQDALLDLLHIQPSRGVVLYIPITEENMATNGTTMAGETSRLERAFQAQEPGLLRTLSRSMGRRMKSTSSQSAPLSEATTSSWTVGGDNQAMLASLTKEPRSSDLSAGEMSRSSKPSKTLRQFVSRRFPDRSGGSGDPE